MNIEYINSEEVQTSSQLNEIFRDKCGIMIDGRIYTSIDSILKVDYLNYRYKNMCEHINRYGEGIKIYKYPLDSDNEVKTPEFERIGELAYAIRFPNQQS